MESSLIIFDNYSSNSSRVAFWEWQDLNGSCAENVCSTRDREEITQNKPEKLQSASSVTQPTLKNNGRDLSTVAPPEKCPSWPSTVTWKDKKQAHPRKIVNMLQNNRPQVDHKEFKEKNNRT